MSANSYPWPALVEGQLRETQQVEYKAGDVLKDSERHKLRLAALAMSNTQDGGYIVIGVEKQQDKSYKAQGVSSDILKSFDPEDLQITLSKCGSPSLQVSVELKQHEANTYVLIAVEPSRGKPTICLDKKGSEDNQSIRQGVIYYRTTGPESKAISAADWDELWSRFASQERVKGVQEHLEATGRQAIPDADTTARVKFDQEAEDIL